ncbi:MAG: aldehyde ferredoxin oxidoreductase family protein [Nitrososphaerales archaeon]
MSSRILYVNLSERSSRVVDRPDLFSKYLGGSGIASKLLLEEVRPGIDPFSPETPIIFAAGYMTGVFPCMVKAIAMFKSPLTKNLGESHSGGHFASALRFAGYGALVIHGASEHPIIIKIIDDEVKIKLADSLWGLSPLDVEKALRECSYEGMQSVISCGKAGENLVCYSNVIVDRFHHFGRLGLGAIFGSKKLKAISILGRKGIPLENPLAVKDMYEKLHHKVVTSDEMSKYHNLGTSANMLELNELGALPTHNFKESRFKDAERISGETMAESLLRRKISCPGCPIACIHLAGLKTSFAPEHERGKKEIFDEEVLVPYNYEAMYALGSNLLIKDKRDLILLIYRCESLGLDAMMMGTVLAWVTEAFEEGRITLDETLGIKPAWGDAEAYTKIIDNTVEMKNKFYAKLAQGVVAASEKYGGREYAMALGNNGMAGYITGYGAILGPLVGARHSHLSNSGYSIDQKIMNKPISIEQMVDFLIDQEDWLYVLYSLGACYFARRIYSKEVVCEALKALGIDKTQDELMKMGKEIFHNLYKFKVREGFELSEQNIPKRIFEVQTPHGKLEFGKIKSMIDYYIKKREKEGLHLKPEEKALKELLK